MANRLIVVFVVLVALTRKSFCSSYSPNFENDEPTELPPSSSYGQSQNQEQNPTVTDHQSSGYSQNNAGGQDNEAKGQGPGDSTYTEPTSPSGSSDGQGGEKYQAGYGGESSTHPKDDSIHFPDDSSDAQDRWKLIYQYLNAPTSGYGYNDEQGQTDASGKKSMNDHDDKTEGKDLGDSHHTEPTSPSDSSNSYDGGKDQAGSKGEDNTNDQNYGKTDQDSKVEDQGVGGTQHTEPASPSGSGYGTDGEKDQSVSGGENNTNDQDEDKNDQGDNTKGQKTEHTPYPFPTYFPRSGYGYVSKLEKTDSLGENNADDNVEGQEPENTHYIEPASPSGSGYGTDGEKDQGVSGGENSTNDQDNEGNDQGDNTKGQETEDSPSPSPVYDSKLDKTDSLGENNANDQDNEKNDQDDNAEGQGPENTYYTEPASLSGSGYGTNGEKDKGVSGGENSTTDQDDEENDQGDNTKGQKTEDSPNPSPVYLPTSGYGYDSKSDKTDSWGENNTNDQDDEKTDQDNNADDQDLEDTHYTEPASPSDSGYGNDGEKDQGVSGGENSTNDQGDEENDQGDNTKGQKIEDSPNPSPVYPPTSGYVYDSELDKTDSWGENNTNDQDGEKNDQDDNTDDQDLEDTHYTEPASPSDSGYGNDGEKDQDIFGEENSTNNQDDDENDQNNNAEDEDNNGEGQDEEGPSYTSDWNHESYDGEQGQTIATGEDNLEEDNSANEQSYAEGQENTEDQDGNQGSTGQGIDITLSEDEVESLTKFGADSALLIGERDNTIILKSDGKKVTIGFNSVEVAVAMLNNVTLENHTRAKSFNLMFRQIANLLKNSGSKGDHYVIQSPSTVQSRIIEGGRTQRSTDI